MKCNNYFVILFPLCTSVGHDRCVFSAVHFFMQVIFYFLCRRPIWNVKRMWTTNSMCSTNQMQNINQYSTCIHTLVSQINISFFSRLEMIRPRFPQVIHHFLQEESDTKRSHSLALEVGCILLYSICTFTDKGRKASLARASTQSHVKATRRTS